MQMRESAQFNLLERSLHRSQGKGGPMRVHKSAQFILERSLHRSQGKGGPMRVRKSAQFNLLERSLHRSQGKGGLYERTGRPSHPPFCKKMLPLGSLLSRDPLPSFPILTPTKITKPLR